MNRHPVLSLFNQTRPLVEPPVGAPVAPVPTVVAPFVPLVAPVDASDVSLVVPPEVQEISIKLQSTELAGSQQSRLALVAPVESGTPPVVPPDVQDISANTHAIMFIGSQQSRSVVVAPVVQTISDIAHSGSDLCIGSQQSRVVVVVVAPVESVVPPVVPPSTQSNFIPDIRHLFISTPQQSRLGVVPSVTPGLVVLAPVVMSLGKMEYFLIWTKILQTLNSLPFLGCSDFFG